jgi:integrase
MKIKIDKARLNEIKIILTAILTAKKYYLYIVLLKITIMASIKFYLTRKNAKTETAIYFLLNYGVYETVSGKKKYLPLKYYTDESIHPEYWDVKAGRVKNTKRFPQYPEFNARLDDIENTVLNILRRLQNDGVTPTNEIIKNELDRTYKGIKNQTTANKGHIEFMQYIDNFIETSNKKESTIKSYKVVRGNLQEYQSKQKTKLLFEKIDIDFYNDFVRFLKSKGYAPNTIGTRIKILKTFLSNADESGLPVIGDYKKKSFTKPREETESIYLNESELTAMYTLKLEKSKKLEHVRDLFLIGAYTGLRFSDLSLLNKDNVSSDIISVRTVKTGAVVNIPIHPVVRAILGKYDGCLPKIPSNQKFNEYIKEVAERAGINESVRVEETKGDLTIKKSEPKYNLVSSHTARRSFATNAYLKDVPTVSIMKITGHKTESAFMKYIKISSQDNARKLLKHDFFAPMRVVNY